MVVCCECFDSLELKVHQACRARLKFSAQAVDLECRRTVLLRSRTARRRCTWITRLFKGVVQEMDHEMYKSLSNNDLSSIHLYWLCDHRTKSSLLSLTILDF